MDSTTSEDTPTAVVVGSPRRLGTSPVAHTPPPVADLDVSVHDAVQGDGSVPLQSVVCTRESNRDRKVLLEGFGQRGPKDDFGNGSAYYFPSGASGDGVQLATGSVWAFFPPAHLTAAKGALLLYYVVVLVTTLGAVGYPLAHGLPEECADQLSRYYWSFGLFGTAVSILLPLWSKYFFGHMLGALQQGLEPFQRPGDRERTIGLGVAVVGATGSALYGLSVAPPPAFDRSPQPCDGANSMIRFASFGWLVATVLISIVHVAHYHYMDRLRQRYLDSRRVVLY